MVLSAMRPVVLKRKGGRRSQGTCRLASPASEPLWECSNPSPTQSRPHGEGASRARAAPCREAPCGHRGQTACAGACPPALQISPISWEGPHSAELPSSLPPSPMHTPRSHWKPRTGALRAVKGVQGSARGTASDPAPPETLHPSQQGAARSFPPLVALLNRRLQHALQYPSQQAQTPEHLASRHTHH